MYVTNLQLELALVNILMLMHDLIHPKQVQKNYFNVKFLNLLLQVYHL